MIGQIIWILDLMDQIVYPIPIRKKKPTTPRYLQIILMASTSVQWRRPKSDVPF